MSNPDLLYEDKHILFVSIIEINTVMGIVRQT
jgi:hypothetical protein